MTGSLVSCLVAGGVTRRIGSIKQFLKQQKGGTYVYTTCLTFWTVVMFHAAIFILLVAKMVPYPTIIIKRSYLYINRCTFTFN